MNRKIKFRVWDIFRVFLIILFVIIMIIGIWDWLRWDSYVNIIYSSILLLSVITMSLDVIMEKDK